LKIAFPLPLGALKYKAAVAEPVTITISPTAIEPEGMALFIVPITSLEALIVLPEITEPEIYVEASY
jgi:hypothetical protein